MPTKSLQERANGSKNELGIGFEGPGVDYPTGVRRYYPCAGRTSSLEQIW